MKRIKYITLLALTFLTITVFSNETGAALVTNSQASVVNNQWPRHRHVWVSGHFRVNRHGRLVWVPGHWRRVRC